MAFQFTDNGNGRLCVPRDRTNDDFKQTFTDLSEFSFHMWVRRTATPASTRDMVIADDGLNDSGWRIQLGTGNTITFLRPYTTANQTRASTSALPLNAWTSLGIVLQGISANNTDVLVYINGVEEGTAGGSGTGTHAVQALQMFFGSPNTTLLGTPVDIGPISFWNRQLAAAEMAALAMGEDPRALPVPMFYWDMNPTGDSFPVVPNLGGFGSLYMALANDSGTAIPTTDNPPLRQLAFDEPLLASLDWDDDIIIASASGGAPTVVSYPSRNVSVFGGR
jgi:hypothetical protein